MHGHSFTWFEMVPGLSALPVHVASALFVFTVLVVFTWLARVQLVRVMQGPEQGLIPESKLTYRNFFEIAAENLYALTESVLGHHDAPKYFPLIGTLFVFIFCSNVVGLVPGFLPSTDNLNTTLALGVVVFAYYNYVGFKEHGIGYLKHFVGPVWWLFFLMIPIELVSHLVRPLSLGLRLRGNIMGDHMVLTIFLEKVPYLIPTIFYGLGLFVSFIQAFVFCLLTMVYISLSSSHDH